MKVFTNKTWETVYFTAKSKGNEATIELSLNHQTKKYNFTTSSEESIRWKDDTIEQTELKIAALQSAFKYLKKQLQ